MSLKIFGFPLRGEEGGGRGREISPTEILQMEDESLSCFLCEESESCLAEDEEERLVDDSNSFLIDPCIEGEEEEEYIGMLFDRETSSGWFLGDPQCCHHDDDHRSPGDWIRRSRIEAFSWILRVSPLSLGNSDNFLVAGHPLPQCFI